MDIKDMNDEQFVQATLDAVTKRDEAAMIALNEEARRRLAAMFDADEDRAFDDAPPQ